MYFNIELDFFELYDYLSKRSKEVLDIIKDNNLEEEFMDYLSNKFEYVPDILETDEFIFFERKTMLKDLGIFFDVLENLNDVEFENFKNAKDILERYYNREDNMSVADLNNYSNEDQDIFEFKINNIRDQISLTRSALLKLLDSVDSTSFEKNKNLLKTECDRLKKALNVYGLSSNSESYKDLNKAVENLKFQSQQDLF